MKPIIFFTIVLVALFSSCSTAYRVGQTPDDVYYSPGFDSKIKKQKNGDNQEYQEYISSQDDAYLRRKVANRNRWSVIDDFSYWNDYRFNFFPSNYNYFNPYFNFMTFNPFYGGHYFGNIGYIPSLGWNNPYYTLIYYSTPTYKGGGTVSTNNLVAARNKSINNNNYYSLPKSEHNNTSREPNFGNLIKTVFTNSGTASYDRSVRTFGTTPTGGIKPSTSSSAGGNSGGFRSTGSSTGTGRGGRNN